MGVVLGSLNKNVVSTLSCSHIGLHPISNTRLRRLQARLSLLPGRLDEDAAQEFKIHYQIEETLVFCDLNSSTATQFKGDPARLPSPSILGLKMPPRHLEP